MTMSARVSRYSVDDEWFVPHSRKCSTIRRSWRSAILRRGRQPGRALCLGGPGRLRLRVAGPRASEGGFYSAEDADSEIPESGDPKPETHSTGNSLETLGSGPVDAGGSLRFPVSALALGSAPRAHFTFGRKKRSGSAGRWSGFLLRPFRGGGVGQRVGCARSPWRVSRQEHSATAPALADTARQFGFDLATAGDRLRADFDRLREARARRPRPHLDDKIITA